MGRRCEVRPTDFAAWRVNGGKTTQEKVNGEGFIEREFYGSVDTEPPPRDHAQESLREFLRFVKRSRSGRVEIPRRTIARRELRDFSPLHKKVGVLSGESTLSYSFG